VLGPVARAAAAGSQFTLTGASDLYAINDAMASLVELAADGQLVVGISSSPHRLELDAGPLVRLDRGGAAGGRLSELVDELRFEPDGHGEMMRLVVLDSGRVRR